MTDRNHQTIEQLMFTALTLTDAATPPSSDTPTPAAAPAMDANAAKVEATAATPENATKSAWSFTTLPAGFQLIKSVNATAEQGKPAVEQIVLSDGMSSVSVFIAPPEQADALKGMEYSAGAMNIFTAQVDKHNIVLVGEVPVATLRAISEGLKHAQ